MNNIKGLNEKSRAMLSELISEVKISAYKEGFETGRDFNAAGEDKSIPNETVYVWKITSTRGENWRITTPGWSIDEALSEFRRVYGYEPVVYSIVYFSELGEFI